MTPHDPPGDVADLLEAIARRLRADPAFAAELARKAGGPARMSVAQPAELQLDADETPELGEVDVHVGPTHVTVTAQTRNVDQSSVHVSVMDRQLILCVGEGDEERRRDVALPADVDEENAVATFRNGVLDVVLPIRSRAHSRHAP